MALILSVLGIGLEAGVRFLEGSLDGVVEGGLLLGGGVHFLAAEEGIGTGDEERVAHLYDPLHPAVLNLVAHIIRGANRVNVPVAVCGEMAGDVRLTRVLLGFGLRQFSMHPAHLLSVKQQVLKSDLGQVMVLAQKMLKSDDPEKLEQLLARMNR